MIYHRYQYCDIDAPVWEPLERVAERTAKRRDLPTVDVDEFMFMGQLRSLDVRPDMHLYKHYNSRRYINIDDALQYYSFLYGEDDKPLFDTTVYYRKLRSLREAVERLELREFGGDRGRHTHVLPENVVPLRRPSRGGSVA